MDYQYENYLYICNLISEYYIYFIGRIIYINPIINMISSKVSKTKKITKLNKHKNSIAYSSVTNATSSKDIDIYQERNDENLCASHFYANMSQQFMHCLRELNKVRQSTINQIAIISDLVQNKQILNILNEEVKNIVPSFKLDFDKKIQIQSEENSTLNQQTLKIGRDYEMKQYNQVYEYRKRQFNDFLFEDHDDIDYFFKNKSYQNDLPDIPQLI